MSEKGQMLSASLIFYIQKSHPLCLPEPSQISHSLALSLCDFFFFSLTCSFHQPVYSFLGYTFQGASPWGLLPQRASEGAASLSSAESEAKPRLVWSLFVSIFLSPSPSPASLASVHCHYHLPIQGPSTSGSLTPTSSRELQPQTPGKAWPRGEYGGHRAETEMLRGQREKSLVRSCPSEP